MGEQLEALPISVSASKRTRKRKAPAPPPISPEAALLREISAKLDRVVAVLAAQGKEKDKQVDILAAAGCDSNFIGVVVGMTGGAVRMRLSRQRKGTARTREGEPQDEAS